MATLTILQIAQLAVNAGVQQGQPLYICVAIAMAESSGRTDATNADSDGSNDVGLWQINSSHSSLWPTGDNRTDPTANAGYMYQLSNSGTNWSPWATYNSGAYMNFMQNVMSTLQTANLTRGTGPTLTTPSTQGAGTGTAVATTQVLNIPGLSNFEQLWSVIDKVFGFLTSPDSWIRILKIGVGIVLVIVGAAMLMQISLPNSKTVATAAEVLA